MGLRTVRVGETIIVKAGMHVGQEGKVLDVGNSFAMVEFSYGGLVISEPVRLADAMRIVTSAIDKEIDSPLAAAEFEQLGNELENLSDEVDAAILAEAERVARESGLPEEIVKAISILPFLKPLLQKLGVSTQAADIVTSLAGGFVTAASMYGVSREVLEKLQGK
jgi:hypothetical protein